MVFFAIAGLVASVIMWQAVAGDLLDQRSDCCGTDIEGLLRSFLACSVGVSITLEGSEPLSVRSHDSMAECILAEARAVTALMGVEFGPVHEIMLVALERASPCGWAPHLVVYVDNEGPLIDVERMPCAPGAVAVAASCHIAGPLDSPLLVSLVLGPSLLPEELGI